MKYAEPKERIPKKKTKQAKPWKVTHCFDVDGVSAWSWMNRWSSSGKFATEEQARQSIADCIKGHNHGFKFKKSHRAGYRLYDPDGKLVEEFFYSN